MTENLEGLGDALRIVVRPPLPPIPATPRVAVLHSGDSAICQTVRDAGLEVAHDYQPETVDDYLDFDRVPAFDLVVAALTEAPEGRERNLETAYRFLYIRRPASFVLVAPGQEIDAALVRHVQGKTKRMGYRARGAVGGGRNFTVGTLGGGPPFIWPPGIVPRQRRRQLAASNDEGPDEGPLEVIGTISHPVIESPEVATIIVVQRVVEWLRRRGS